jgi:hypothetical protein
MTKHIRISRRTKSPHFSQRNVRIPKRTTTTGASCVGSSETSRTPHAFFRRLVDSPCARMCCHGTNIGPTQLSTKALGLFFCEYKGTFLQFNHDLILRIGSQRRRHKFKKL